VAATTTKVPLVTPYYTPVTTPITTVTVTPTSTVNSCSPPSATPDQSCENQGIQVAYYSNSYQTTDDAYSTFDPTYLKTTTPGFSAVTSSAGGISDSCDNGSEEFYGNTGSCNQFALNYRGYLYAGQTGTFTFSVSQADNLVLIWAGSLAYSGWTRSNAFMDVTFQELGGGGGAGTATYTASAGQYIPLRIVFAQGTGPFNYALQVTAPDGTVVLNGNSATNKFLVQHSCDGTSAPAYPHFGHET